jgi:hypothetical protein
MKTSQTQEEVMETRSSTRVGDYKMRKTKSVTIDAMRQKYGVKHQRRKSEEQKPQPKRQSVLIPKQKK